MSWGARAGHAFAGTVAVIAGIVVGNFSFGYIMRYHDDFPGMLEWIPYAGPWLKLGLGLILWVATFALTCAAVYEGLKPKAKSRP
jgi:hypothetical protein